MCNPQHCACRSGVQAQISKVWLVVIRKKDVEWKERTLTMHSFRFEARNPHLPAAAPAGLLSRKITGEVRGDHTKKVSNSEPAQFAWVTQVPRSPDGVDSKVPLI